MTNGNPPAAGARQARLATVLRAHFAPVMLDVEDESARHAGHSGARAGGETHYKIKLVSEMFTGLSRIERSRRVHSLLKGEFEGGLHALSLKLSSPDEM